MTPSLILGVLFVLIIGLMMAVDLRMSSSAGTLSLRTAGMRTLLWVGAAVLFFIAIAVLDSPAKATEFMTGYLIEESLSVDNLFVFIMIFSYFNIEPGHQPRVLKWGIIGAVVMRLVLILLGTYLVRRFEWVFFIFGAILIFSAYKMVFGVEKDFNPEDNVLFRWVRKVLPMTGFFGNRFFVKQEGRWHATPLLLTVMVVEFSDLVFALDSIPAIFSITTDPFIVYTSNIFAIMGLRSLFFVVSGLVQMFAYLKYGVAVILAFVGIKMLVVHWVHISTMVSLGVVVSLLAGSVGLSLVAGRKNVP